MEASHAPRGILSSTPSKLPADTAVGKEALSEPVCWGSGKDSTAMLCGLAVM